MIGLIRRVFGSKQVSSLRFVPARHFPHNEFLAGSPPQRPVKDRPAERSGRGTATSTAGARHRIRRGAPAASTDALAPPSKGVSATAAVGHTHIRVKCRERRRAQLTGIFRVTTYAVAAYRRCGWSGRSGYTPAKDFCLGKVRGSSGGSGGGGVPCALHEGLYAAGVLIVCTEVCVRSAAIGRYLRC